MLRERIARQLGPSGRMADLRFFFKGGDGKKLGFILVLQVILNLIELVAVGLIGAVGALTATAISGDQPGIRVGRLLQTLRLDDFSSQAQVLVFASVSALLLISKTIFSAIMSRKVIFFFAARSGFMTRKLLGQILSGNFELIRRFDSHTLHFGLTQGIQSVSVGVIANSVNLASDVILLIVMLVGLFLVEPTMAVLSLSVFVSVLIILWFLMSEKTKNISQQITKVSIKNSSLIFELFHSLREVRIRGREPYYLDQISKRRDKELSLSASLQFIPSLAKYLIDIIIVLLIVMVAGMQFFLSDGGRALGNISIFLAASFRLAPAVLRVQQGALMIRNGLASVKPTIELVNSFRNFPSPQELKVDQDHSKPEFRATIDIENVSFRFSDSDTYTLDEVSFRVPEGCILGITGPSGSGKSTLVDIILGLYRSTSGRVTVSGVEPEIAVKRYPGAISYVPQSALVIDGSIKENLTVGYGDDVWNDEDLWHVLEMTRLSDIVRNYPNGLETQVGERGDKLSGGQRQRLCLARALLTNPKLLIMDESTSALDMELEQSITDAIMGMKGRVTVILIAHRLETIKRCDQVVFLESGKVRAIGKFEDLIAKIPAFASVALK